MHAMQSYLARCGSLCLRRGPILLLVSTIFEHDGRYNLTPVVISEHDD